MMGLVKEYMLERHDEEMGASPLSWSDVKRALRFLLATEEMEQPGSVSSSASILCPVTRPVASQKSPACAG